MLIILAAVTIIEVTDSGLVDRTVKSAEEYAKAENKGNEMLKDMEVMLSEMLEERPVIIVSQLDEWTREKEVIIEGQEGYIIKYTTDGEEPGVEKGEEYKDKITIDKKCVIKAVYVKEERTYGEISEENISKIDKEEPDVLEISLTPDKKSIKVNINNVKDANENKESGSSGIAKIRARLNKDTSTWTEYQDIDTNSKTYTFDNIYGDLAGQKCTIEVEAIDQAGNIKQIESTATTTCKNEEHYINQSVVVATIGGRDYIKYNNEGAAAAVRYSYDLSDKWNWSHILLVGLTPDSVKYTTTFNNEIIDYGTTVEYYGTTYYICGGTYAMQITEETSIKSNFGFLNTFANPYIWNRTLPNALDNYRGSAIDLLNIYFKNS